MEKIRLHGGERGGMREGRAWEIAAIFIREVEKMTYG